MNQHRTETIAVDGREVSCTIIRRAGQKHIRIRVTHDGQLRVSAPERCRDTRIAEVLDTKASWISRHIRKAEANRAAYEPAKMVWLRGDRFTIVQAVALERRPGIRVDTEGRIINVTCRAESEIQHELVKFLRREAGSFLPPRIRVVSERIGIPVRRIFVRDQRTRWGSSSSLGNISLNWRLVMAPREVIDYLAYHEIAHQIHMNHSSGFWEIVARWCPDYERLDRWLGDHAYLLAMYR